MSAICPECDSPIDVMYDVDIGDEPMCSECGSLLRVPATPAEFEIADDDPDEEEEEAWIG